MLRLQASDEENKAKSKSLGKQGIILSIVGAVFVIVFVLLGSLCAQNMMETQLGDGNPDFPVLSLIGAIAFYFLAFYLGLGGSATNDAGCGMAAALGFEFRDKNNTKFIPTGDTLCKIASITAPKEQINAKIIVLCDVDNVLFGKNGAAYVYARQKGANDEQIKVLDDNLRYFNDLTKQNGVDFSQYKGSGAAGGLAAGAVYFLNATLQSGINTFFELTNIREKISKADFVITGEGKIDKQSMHGKVVFELHKICESKKFVAFCGTNELDFSPFQIISINKPNTPLSQSILDTKQNFTNALTQYLKSLN